jgi:hypothetical protein
MGSIELQVTTGTPPMQKTVIVKFLVADRLYMYKAILGRTALNELKSHDVNSPPVYKVPN